MAQDINIQLNIEGLNDFDKVSKSLTDVTAKIKQLEDAGESTSAEYKKLLDAQTKLAQKQAEVLPARVRELQTATETVRTARQYNTVLQDIIAVQSQIPQGTAAFEELNQVQSQLRQSLAENAGALGDASDALRTIDGSPVERAAGSFGLLSESVTSLDLGKFEIGLQGVQSLVGELPKNFSQLGGAVTSLGAPLKALFTTLSLNPFILIVGAVVALVAILVTLKDRIGIIGKAFEFLSNVIQDALNLLTAFTDFLGLTQEAERRAAEESMKLEEERREAIQQRGDLQEEYLDKIQDLSEKEIQLLEKQIGVELDKNTNRFDIRKKQQEELSASYQREMDKIMKIVEQGGVLNDEEKKRYDELKTKKQESDRLIVQSEIDKQNRIREIQQSAADFLRSLEIRNIQNVYNRQKAELDVAKETELAKVAAAEREAASLGQNTEIFAKQRAEIEKFYINQVNTVDRERNQEAVNRRKDRADKAKSAAEKQANDELEALRVQNENELLQENLSANDRLNIVEQGLQKEYALLLQYQKLFGLSDTELANVRLQNEQRVAEQREANRRFDLESENRKNLALAELSVLQAVTEEGRITARIEQLGVERDIKLQNESLFNEERLLIEAQYNQSVAELNLALQEVIRQQTVVTTQQTADETTAIQTAAAKKSAEEAIAIKKQEILDKTNATLTSIGQELGSISQLVDTVFAIRKNKAEKGSKEEEKIARKQFEYQKALQIGLAVINGIQSILAITSVPDFTLGVASAIRIGAQIALNAASIAKIASTKFQSSGGGGGSSVSLPSVGGASIATPSTPTSGNQPQNLNSLTPAQFVSLINAGQQSQQVFVLENDITTVQRQVEVIENRAKIN